MGDASITDYAASKVTDDPVTPVNLQSKHHNIPTSVKHVHAAALHALEHLSALGVTHLRLGYSGGLDSCVLLHAIQHLLANFPNLSVAAMHINHQLHANAGVWQQHCSKVCAQGGINFYSQKIDIEPAHPDGTEARARALRYQALAHGLGLQDCVLTAQHADDQAETVLLQAIRGAGVDGLAGMSYGVKRLEQTQLLRPLLSLSRATLQVYADHFELQWIEDSSNFDLRYSRNFIRHQVLPPLMQHRHASIKNLARVAENMAEAQHILQQIAAEDFAKCQVSGAINQLQLPALLNLSLQRQRLLLRFWWRQQGIRMPSRKALLRLQQQLPTLCLPRQSLMLWDGRQIAYYQHRLYCLSRSPKMSLAWEMRWSGTKDCHLPEQLGSLYTDDFPIQAWFEHFNSDHLVVRLRRGGERYTSTLEATHQRRLKDSFSQWQIPPWQRERIPLLYCAGQLVAVCGFWVLNLKK